MEPEKGPNSSDSPDATDEPTPAEAPTEAPTCLEKWGSFTDSLMRPLVYVLVGCSKFSAKRPVLTCFFTTAVALGIFVLGAATNFSLETDNAVLWTPRNSITADIDDWATGDIGFEDPVFTGIYALVDAGGSNVLTVEGARYAFSIIEIARSMPLYQQLCLNEDGSWKETECPIRAVTEFWEDSLLENFEAEIESDEDVREAMSKFAYHDGSLVNRLTVIGKPDPNPTLKELSSLIELAQSRMAVNNNNNNITSQESLMENPFVQAMLQKYKLNTAESFIIQIRLPYSDELSDELNKFQNDFVDKFLKLKEDLAQDPENTYGYDVTLTCDYSGAAELTRGLRDDAYLVYVAFLVMVLFCSAILSKPDRVKSQSLLGVGAVAAVFISVALGYGIMFCVGIPLTTLSALLPFILLGIGVDNLFIITGCLERTDPNEDITKRIELAMEEAGTSITVSSTTTIVAYVLGSAFSSMPGVAWFCVYASTMIFTNFLYQITFFVAVYSIDDRRIKANRYDVFFCCKRNTESEETNNESMDDNKKNTTFSSKLLDKYSDILLMPKCKAAILVFFAALLGVGIFFAEKIEVQINFFDLFPDDSYVKDYVVSIDEYTDVMGLNSNAAYFYFRDEDFGDPEVQNQMTQYVDEITETPYVNDGPFTFWLRDFNGFIRLNDNETFQNATFNEQLDIFLNTSPFRELYSSDIVLDEDGNMVLSRVPFIYDRVDAKSSAMQSDAYLTQLDITVNQEINNGSPFGSFFNHGKGFLLWQTWHILLKEIIHTLLLGLLSVFLVSMVFVKHPVCAIILTGVVTAVFFEVVAVYHLTGLAIHQLTAIGLITCIGLVVDFSIHICIAYFEIRDDSLTQNERVKRVLMTMGKSVTFGGLTTFLGIVPLGFNSVLTFKVIFVTFVSITVLGVAHALMLVPVLLSFIKPVKMLNKGTTEV